MIDKEKILAKIESLLNEINYEPYTDETFGRIQSLKELKSYIDSLQEEPVSEDLEKESYHAAMRMLNNHDLILPSTTNAQLCTAYQKFYKEAANWQKEQMMKDVVEIPLHQWLPALLYNKMSEKGFKDGDKVKLIIVKEEEK